MYNSLGTASVLLDTGMTFAGFSFLKSAMLFHISCAALKEWTLSSSHVAGEYKIAGFLLFFCRTDLTLGSSIRISFSHYLVNNGKWFSMLSAPSMLMYVVFNVIH